MLIHLIRVSYSVYSLRLMFSCIFEYCLLGSILTKFPMFNLNTGPISANYEQYLE